MMRPATRWTWLAASVATLAGFSPITAMADRWEVRRELREDYYRDQYYRGGQRWYRDGRYWDRDEYERRYYRKRGKGDDDFLKGAVVGAAVVGIGVAIAKSNDD